LPSREKIQRWSPEASAEVPDPAQELPIDLFMATISHVVSAARDIVEPPPEHVQQAGGQWKVKVHGSIAGIDPLPQRRPIVTIHDPSRLLNDLGDLCFPFGVGGGLPTRTPKETIQMDPGHSESDGELLRQERFARPGA